MNWWAFQTARSIYNSDIRVRKPSWWFKVRMYIIGSVNHTDGKQFKRWQGFFTYDKIYFECYLSSEWVKKSAIKNVLARMKKDGKLTTQKTTRWFIITVLKYNDYQTLDNYKNHTEKKSKRTHKENTNHTITKEWKNDNNIIWTSEQKEYVWKIYPHARKWKKQDSIKYMQNMEYETVLQQVKVYKWEVNTWLQDAKFVPASERWFRDFVAYSESVAIQKKKQMYKILLDSRNTEAIKQFTEDFWEKEVLQMYNEIKEEQRKNLLSWLQ